MDQVLTTIKETVTDKNFLIGLGVAGGIFSVTRYVQGRRHRKNIKAIAEQIEKDLRAVLGSE